MIYSSIRPLLRRKNKGKDVKIPPKSLTYFSQFLLKRLPAQLDLSMLKVQCLAGHRP